MAAQRGTKPKGTSSPLQQSQLSLLAQLQSQSQNPPPAAITNKEILDTLNIKFGDMEKNMLDLKQQMRSQQDQMDQMNQTMEEMRDQAARANQDIRNDVVSALSGLAVNLEFLDDAVKETQKDVGKLEYRADKLEERADRIELEQLLFQYKQLEAVLRVRGLPEDKDSGKGEDLRVICAEAFAPLLQVDPKEILQQIEKAYRVNSWYARQRNLPRDVVVHLERRYLRNEIVQAAYHQRCTVRDQEVKVLKEIPLKMLRLRKEFKFLTDELKKRNLQFRWELPIGVTLIYSGKRYRLDSTQKARDFYSKVLNAGEPGLESEKTQPVQQEPIEIAASSLASVDKQLVERLEEAVGLGLEFKEQRITRATAKKMEKTIQQLRVSLDVPTQSEAVGGARPKRFPTDMRAMPQKLQTKLDDGQAADLEC